MKTKFVVAAILGLAGLFLTQTVSAQNPYISNLGQTPIGGMQIGSDSWIAQSFITGNTASSYILNSVQLLMDPGSGSPAGLSVSIYSKSGALNSASEPADHPQTSLATFTGPDPSAGGLFTFTSSSGVTLQPNAFYYVLLTSTTPVAQGDYVWSAAGGVQDATTGWTIDDTYSSSSNGSSWTWVPRKDVFQMALSFTPAPEPRSFAIAGLALVCFAIRRVWKKRTHGA